MRSSYGLSMHFGADEPSARVDRTCSDIDVTIAREIAAGERCPITRQLIVDSWVDFRPGRAPGLSNSSKVDKATKRPPAPVVASQGQRKISDMFSQFNPLCRKISGPLKLIHF